MRDRTTYKDVYLTNDENTGTYKKTEEDKDKGNGSGAEVPKREDYYTIGNTGTYTQKNYGPFTYDDYAESDLVKAARDKANQYSTFNPSDNVNNLYSAWQNNSSTKPGAFDGGATLAGRNDIQNQILNRDAFSYDLNADALYQQYKNQYMTQGNLAMQDAYGQATALTGGYGSSYAVTAGNQAYQGYLNKLNDVIPQLYQLAYDKYNNETNELYNRYNMMNSALEQEYNQYRDTVSDWYTEDNRLANAYYNAYDQEYNNFNNDRNYYTDRYDTEATKDYNHWQTGYNNAYTQHTDLIAQDQWERNLAEEQRQFNEQMGEKRYQYDDGVIRAEAQAQAQAVAEAQAQEEETKANTLVSNSRGTIMKDSKYADDVKKSLEIIEEYKGSVDPVRALQSYDEVIVDAWKNGEINRDTCLVLRGEVEKALSSIK